VEYYGTAEVIGVTAPVDKLAGLDLTAYIAYVARVSNPSNQSNHLTAENLLNYLVRESHWSPFEMVNVVMEINTTRDIARQILRHRSFSFQEFSQRYADPTEHLGFVTREARLQDKKNRQSSLETDDQDLHDAWEHKQDMVKLASEDAYRWAVDNGIAKEVARSVLPEGMMASRLYVNGTLRSWLHFCQVRTAKGTQAEHRQVARACWALIRERIPAMANIAMEVD